MTEISGFLLTGYVLLPPKEKQRLVFKQWQSRDILSKWHPDTFETFSISMFDNALAEKLITCDLNGGFRTPTIYDIDWWLDIPFDINHSNLKAAASMRDRCGLVKPMAQADGILHENKAQVTIVESTRDSKKYLHFNMTTYSFWEDVKDYLSKTYHVANLGGWMFRVGVDSIVDEKFKDIL